MLKLTLRDGQRLLLEEEVESVRLPGSQGELEVMAYHVPLVAALRPGRILINKRQSLRVQAVKIRGGLAWMVSDRLVVLVESLP